MSYYPKKVLDEKGVNILAEIISEIEKKLDDAGCAGELPYLSANGTGSNAATTQVNSVALGYAARTKANSSTALGHNCQTSSAYSTAIGANATCVGMYGVALGHGSNAYLFGAIAIGNGANVNASGGVALGRAARARQDDAIAIGNGANVNATHGIAIGANAAVNGNHSIAIGSEVKIPNTVSNVIFLGDANIESIQAAVTTITSLSDERTKEEIIYANIAQCLVDIERVPVRRFKFKKFARRSPKDVHVTGFVAQEMQSIFPKSIHTYDEDFPVLDENGEPVMENELDENGNIIYEEDCITPKQKEKRFTIENVQHLSLDHALPTLWGAVQYLSKQVKALMQFVNFKGENE